MSPAPRHHDPIFLCKTRVGGINGIPHRSTGKALMIRNPVAASGLTAALFWQMLTAWIPT